MNLSAVFLLADFVVIKIRDTPSQLKTCSAATRTLSFVPGKRGHQNKRINLLCHGKQTS
jgi:hypothetical protein